MNDNQLITIVVFIVLTMWLMAIFNWITVAKRKKLMNMDDMMDVLVIFATTIALLLLTIMPIGLAISHL